MRNETWLLNVGNEHLWVCIPSRTPENSRFNGTAKISSSGATSTHAEETCAAAYWVSETNTSRESLPKLQNSWFSPLPFSHVVYPKKKRKKPGHLANLVKSNSAKIKKSHPFKSIEWCFFYTQKRKWHHVRVCNSSELGGLNLREIHVDFSFWTNDFIALRTAVVTVIMLTQFINLLMYTCINTYRKGK